MTHFLRRSVRSSVRFLPALVAPLLCALGACAPSDPSGPLEAAQDAGDEGRVRESGAPDAGDAAAPLDDAGPGDAAPDASGPTADGRGARPSGTTTSTGGVLVRQSHSPADGGGDAYYVTFGAGFAADLAPLAGNTSRTLGPCTITKDTEPDTRPEQQVNGGTITVLPKGIPLGAFEDVLGYEGSHLTSKVFEPGDVITARGTGATAPAFALSTAAPSDVTWTSPSCDAKTCTIDRTHDFSLSWTGSDYGWVNIHIAVEGHNTEGVSCMFPANAHQATIPAEAFADFESTVAPNFGRVTVYPSSTAWVVQGDWAISLVVESQAAGPILLQVPQ